MRTPALLGALALTLGVRSLAAQACATPVPDSLNYVGGDSTPMPLAAFRRAVLAAVRERGYRIAPDSDSLSIRTEPRYEWPDRDFFDPLRSRPNPGATVTFTLHPMASATRWDVIARAVCMSPTDRPQPGQAPVERAAPAAAAFDILMALTPRLPKSPRPKNDDSGVPPEVVSCPAPRLPAEVIRTGALGRVVVSAIVDTAGSVEPGSVFVMTSVRPELDSAAAASAQRCFFAPGRLHGRPVAVRIQLPFDFAGP